MAAAAHVGAALGVAALCSDDCPAQRQQQQQQHHGACSARTFARVPSPAALSSFASRVDGALARPVSYVQQGSCSASRFSPVCEVAVDGSSNASAVASPNLELNAFAKKEMAPSQKPHAVQETTISALMADVANLVKLVDSRDIVELELKNSDYEILIRKKEALPPPPPAIPQLYPQAIAQTSLPTYAPPPPMPATHLPFTPTTSPSPPPPPPAALALTAPAKSPAMEHPQMLSPMAGTFYRSPAPGEPAFVKIGDRVQKGQVICIVEAMKLMNEIEADHSGTIIDIIAEDGKPVSVDTPLFVIKP